jgi:hypothetical protein
MCVSNEGSVALHMPTSLHTISFLDRTLKNTFNTKPEGVRSVGRPKVRWEGGVNQDMKTSAVKNWKNDAFDSDEWTQILQMARVQQGLSSL